MWPAVRSWDVFVQIRSDRLLHLSPNLFTWISAQLDRNKFISDWNKLYLAVELERVWRSSFRTCTRIVYCKTSATCRIAVTRFTPTDKVHGDVIFLRFFRLWFPVHGGHGPTKGCRSAWQLMGKSNQWLHSSLFSPESRGQSWRVPLWTVARGFYPSTVGWFYSLWGTKVGCLWFIYYS